MGCDHDILQSVMAHPVLWILGIVSCRHKIQNNLLRAGRGLTRPRGRGSVTRNAGRRRPAFSWREHLHATSVVFVGRGRSLLAVLLLTLTLAFGITGSATAEPAGDVIIAWHVTLASSWLDPATAPPQITPFAVLYALHDTLIRPLPGQRIGASLAESWRRAPTGSSTSSRSARA